MDGPPPGVDERARLIPTPDQRLRVFISSTMLELAEERRAVRDAVTRLRLIPVLFELGARAHPPRDLYRAYLAQSDVFVGIYGDQYGWVAPEMGVSGLEDEYDLSAGMPRLLYVRRAAAAREPRLERLIERMQGDGDASTTSTTTRPSWASWCRTTWPSCCRRGSLLRSRPQGWRPAGFRRRLLRSSTVGRNWRWSPVCSATRPCG